MGHPTSDIWTVPHFLTEGESESLIARAERIGFEAATINSTDGPKRDTAIRNNDRIILDDQALADELWPRLAPDAPSFLDGRQAIGLNERFRFYRYGPEQQFRGHIDHAFTRENGETSLLTFMVYLNSGYSGGETSFPTTTIQPQTGMALIFRHSIFHEGCRVLSGWKYILRSDVMFDVVGRVRG